VWTDYGTEYDCEYEYADEVTCEDCIYCDYGGDINPATGKRNKKKYKRDVRGAR